MKCRLCDNNKLELVTNKLRRGKGVVWKCNNCDYMMLEPSFESVERYYDEEYRKKFSDILDDNEETPEQIFEARKDFQGDRLQIISKYFNHDKTFLEIGSSAGQFLYKIESEFKSITGIELSKKCVDYAKKKCKGDFYTSPIEKIKWNGKTFDYIGAFQVLEHIENPIKFLKSISECLDDSGKIFIEVPTCDDPLRTVWKVSEYEDFFYHEAHLSYFTENSIRILFEKAGFEIEDIVYYQDYNLFNHLSWYFSRKPQKTCEFGLNKPTFDFDLSIKDELNALFCEMNDRYFEILSRNKKTSNFMVIAKKK